MEHYFKAGLATAPPLLLLHGTGGDEHSLVEVAELLSKASTVLALRGMVSEEGANRFFRRFAEGHFDLVDLEMQTDELLRVVSELSLHYGVNLQDWVVVGYSNGANIAAHAILERENGFQNAILFHAMSLGKHEATFDLSHKKIWLAAGINDPIVPKSETDALLEAFSSRNQEVETHWTTTGHQLTYEEVIAAKSWLNQQFSADVGETL